MIDPFGAKPQRSASGGGQALPGLDKIVSELLGQVRVVDPILQEAVVQACREIWPEMGDDDVLVGGFRAGTLNLLLDSHARLAEAKNFVAEDLRERINEILSACGEEQAVERDQQDDQGTDPTGNAPSKSLAHAKRMASPARKQKEGNYVTRIHFYLRGTK